MGIAEFRKCSWADEIISQLLRWSFGYFNASMQLWVREGCPSTELAMAAFQETARDLAIRALIELINTTSDDYTRIEAAVCLSKIDSSHPKVLGTLLQLIHTSSSQDTRRWAASMLEKIGTEDNQKAIDVLAELVDESDDEFIRNGASFSLGKIAPNHPKAGKIAEPTLLLEYVKLGKIDLGNPEWIAWLVEEVRASANELYQFALGLQGSYEDGEMESILERETLVQYIQLVFRCSQALLNLRYIAPGHPEAIKVLIDVIHSSVNDYICAEAIRSLGRIGKRTPEAIALLIDLIRNSQNFTIRWRAVQGLWHTETSHEKAIWMLIDVIRTAPDGRIRMEAAQSLGQILQRHPFVSAISDLKDCLPTQICNNKDFALYQECYQVLWCCAQTMPYPAFYKAWHNQYTTSPS